MNIVLAQFRRNLITIAYVLKTVIGLYILPLALKLGFGNISYDIAREFVLFNRHMGALFNLGRLHKLDLVVMIVMVTILSLIVYSRLRLFVFDNKDLGRKANTRLIKNNKFLLDESKNIVDKYIGSKNLLVARC